MATYAKDTEVSVEKSQMELERTLERFGATGFMRGWDKQANVAVLVFEIRSRRVKLTVPMPTLEDVSRRKDGSSRPIQHRKGALDQATKQRWRAFNLIVKAKLEAIESGISTIEDEFMANILLPSGQTIGQWMQPQIEAAYRTGHMPPLLSPATVNHDEGEIVEG